MTDNSLFSRKNDLYAKIIYFCFCVLDIGAAYGTAKAGSGISSIGVWKPSIIMKSLIPVVMAGILGIYGMIVSVILIQKSKILKGLQTTERNPYKNNRNYSSFAK